MYIHVNQKLKRMKFIKLTSVEDGKPVYINIEMIGHMYEVPKDNHTRVGVRTHNNGGFRVAEDVDQIMKLIEKAK